MIKQLSLFLVAGLVLGLVGFAVAQWVIPDHDEIPGNDYDTASPVVIDVGVNVATGFVWLPIVDAAPGDIAVGDWLVVNNNAFPVYVDMSTVSTNSVLANALLLRIGTDPSGACDYPYHNADGTTNAMTDDVEVYNGPLEGASFGGLEILNSGTSNLFTCFSLVFPTTEENNVALADAQNSTTFIFDSDDTP